MVPPAHRTNVLYSANLITTVCFKKQPAASQALPSCSQQGKLPSEYSAVFASSLFLLKSARAQENTQGHPPIPAHDSEVLLLGQGKKNVIANSVLQWVNNCLYLGLL